MKNKQSLYFEDWLVKAKRDSDTAFLNHRNNGYTDTTCYFCHQTVEKALKAFLLATGVKKLPYIHSLPVLLAFCKKKDEEFVELTELCIKLNKYYIETKYPISPPFDYSKDEAEEAIKSADEILKFVEKKIKQINKT